MLRYAIIFFIVAEVLGFGGIAGGAASIAQVLFYIFILLLVVSVLKHLVTKTA